MARIRYQRRDIPACWAAATGSAGHGSLAGSELRSAWLPFGNSNPRSRWFGFVAQDRSSPPLTRGCDDRRWGCRLGIDRARKPRPDGKHGFPLRRGFTGVVKVVNEYCRNSRSPHRGQAYLHRQSCLPAARRLPAAAADTPRAAGSTCLINDYGAFHRSSRKFRRSPYRRGFCPARAAVAARWARHLGSLAAVEFVNVYWQSDVA